MRKIAPLILYLFVGNTLANDLDRAYQEGIALAKSHAHQPMDALKGLDVSKLPNPPEQNYYQGVTQNKAGLETIAQEATKKSGAAKAIQESIHTRPLAKIDMESESMQNLHKIADAKEGFCLDGNCSSQDFDAFNEADFKKAISMLSGAQAASKDKQGSKNFIFKGERLECSTLMLGAKNCCRESGWGVDMNLLHCEASEKKLGKAREKKLTIATGEYCYERKKWPGGSKCVERHRTFCVFESKLSRIVQEQGRRKQLGIGFGEGKHTNCSGITPAQLQKINFELIDFKETFSDIQAKKIDVGKTGENLKNRLQDLYNQGGSRG
jgi:Type-1V conjugative transfer system mating pair stabilisation